MARPPDFYPIALTEEHEANGRRHAAAFVAKDGNPFAWVGLAAELAVAANINSTRHGPRAKLSEDLRWDLELWQGQNYIPVEVKTRVASKGWTDPARFEWIGIPTHEGREPVKPEAQLVLFCWWSADEPRRLWVLGRLLGIAEFKKRATWFGEGEPTPRGGAAPKGGTYILDVTDLRPVPRGLFLEDRS